MPTTSWTLVLSASRSGDADAALARLCEAYWYPLYAFLRRQGYAIETCEDLTQGFFAKLIEKNYLAGAAPHRGRFRSFLLASLKHYAANERDFETAQKRGGTTTRYSIDVQSAEGRLAHDTTDPGTPESIYERDWALALLDRVRAILRDDWARLGKQKQFEEMQPFLIGNATPLADAAARLEMSEGAFRVAVHRLRKQFRETLRDEIAATVEDPKEVDEELAFLIAALSR